MTCVILGAVPEDADLIREYTKNAFVICADGGLDTALKNNIRPDLIVGDFDSAETDVPEGIETIRLPVHKDDTDMLFAVKEGFRRGCQNFFLLGALLLQRWLRRQCTKFSPRYHKTVRFGLRYLQAALRSCNLAGGEENNVRS